MTEKKTSKKKSTALVKSAGAAAEGVALSAMGLAAGHALGPAGGIAAAAGLRFGISWLKDLVSGRGAKRTEDYARALDEAVGAGDEARFAELAANEQFNEVVFQTYRKAMDALCPAVVPSLARLAAHYKDRPLDPLFRGLGRTLQDIEDDQVFDDLRSILSAIVQVGGEQVDVEPYESEPYGFHLRLSVDPRRLRFENGISSTPLVFGLRAERGVTAIFSLLERNGLNHVEYGRGRDLALAGSWTFGVDVCRRAVHIVGATALDLFANDVLTLETLNRRSPEK
jgi:hypothetical protein